MDIVERLTVYRPFNYEGDGREHHVICDEAATTITALRKRVAELEGVLEPLVHEFGCSIELYDKNGPDWTHKDGTEVFEVSTLLDRRELIDRARAALRAKGGGDAHPDDLAVDRFAAAMKAKLAQKRAEGRGGWEDKNDCSSEWLSNLLRGHVDKGDPVDVANFAMMLHQRGERIAP